MSNPLVSVIFPARNGEAYLEESIESVLSQDYDSFEVLLVDDQSTDGTAAIADRYPTLQRLEGPGQGVGKAWNTALEVAQGEVIAFQAQDDIWLPGKLTRQVGFMQEHPEYDYSVTKTNVFLQNGHTLPPGARPEHIGQDLCSYFLEAMMFRKSLLDKVGLFDPDLGTNQDGDWLARIKDAGMNIGTIDEVLLRRRIHNNNTTYSAVMAQEGNQDLLSILRSSIQRQRAKGDE